MLEWLSQLENELTDHEYLRVGGNAGHNVTNLSRGRRGFFTPAYKRTSQYVGISNAEGIVEF